VSVQIIRGDCLDVLKTLPDASVDSCVTDPPYGLKFMGKLWDHGIPAAPYWVEVLRVLKPGAHLLAFGGTRTYHRLACAIEDAGFEIRDQIGYAFGSGFPKSHNLDRHRGALFCGCGDNHHEKPGPVAGANETAKKRATPESKEEAKHGMRSLWDENISAPECAPQERDEVLQPYLSEPAIGKCTPAHASSGSEARQGVSGRQESSVEGRSNSAASARELCTGPVCESARMGTADGEEGRLCDGASACDGEPDRPDSAAHGGGSPRRSCAAEQRDDEPGVVAGQSEPQTLGAWPNCGRCGLPIIPSGLGTALKPAWEPIVMARKPLVGTVAANVERFGTGGLNIEECRVGTAVETWPISRSYAPGQMQPGHSGETQGTGDAPPGRWPANLIHDGSEEVLACFPANAGAAAPVHKRNGDKFRNTFGAFAGDVDEAGSTFQGDSGSAARFFYCAKASRQDRNEGLRGRDKKLLNWSSGTQSPGTFQAPGTDRTSENHHPTVKPTDLMRYLCRLVTPKGGTVLDPFMGSGSTGRGAIREGFGFIGIEIDAEYCEIACLRIHADAPLFAEVA